MLRLRDYAAVAATRLRLVDANFDLKFFHPLLRNALGGSGCALRSAAPTHSPSPFPLFFLPEPPPRKLRVTVGTSPSSSSSAAAPASASAIESDAG